jgi:hypothetical protein
MAVFRKKHAQNHVFLHLCLSYIALPLLRIFFSVIIITFLLSIYDSNESIGFVHGKAAV